MAVTRIGSLVESADAERTANTGSESITVPADAEIMIVGVHGYQSISSYFSGGAGTRLTIAGAAFTNLTQGDASTSFFMGALFYRLAPATGTQTLAWDWAGTDAPTEPVRIVYGFYKGLHATTPIRDTDGVQSNLPYTTPSLTAASGDLIVAWGWGYDGADETGGSSWTNASVVTDYPTRYGNAVASWAEGSPSGNTTVTWSAWTGVEDGGVCALVLTPAAAGAAGNPWHAYAQQ